MTDHDSAILLDLETSLHKGAVRQSADALTRLLSDDFVEFGSSGMVFNKSTIIQALATEQGGDLNVSVHDFQARELAEGVVLVTYISSRSIGSEASRSLRSSIWKLTNGSWQMVFHQGTRIP